MSRSLLSVVGLALLLPAALHAQYQRHVEDVFPRVGQRGTTTEVVIRGMFLQDPQQILFYRSGLQATDLTTLPDLQQFDAAGKLNTIDRRIGGRAFGAQVKEQFRAQVEIPAGSGIGLHPLRVRTGEHLTTLATFWVTPFPVQAEAEPYESQPTNNTPQTAEVLTAENVTVCGYINPGPAMDRDVYRLTRKQGERISVDVNSVRASMIWWARAELDLVVRILDASGRELALADDSALHVQDPLTSILAPADGDYFVEIQQSLFSNTSNSFYQHYLAHIGKFEAPQALYPAGGPPGQPLDVTLLGDPAGELRRSILPPKGSGDVGYDFGGSYELPMRVTDHRNVLEGAAGAITDAGEPLVALNGIIRGPNEADEFRLTPRKGQSYLVRVYARSLGTPLDPQIEIRHEQSGDIEAAGDDVANYDERGLPGVPLQFRRLEIMDPSVVWTPKQDGPSILKITDTRNLGGPTCVYRVEIQPVENRVNTFLFSYNYSRESPRDSGLAIPAGNRWTLQFGLSPGQGNPFKGDLQLVAEGLPEGVEMLAPPIKAVNGTYPGNVPVQFVAKPGTTPRAKLIRVLARPVEAGVELQSRAGQAILYVGDHFGQSSNSLVVDRYALAVTNPAPFAITVDPPQIPLIQDGELSVKVQLHRQPGFDEPIAIVSAWNPPGVGAQPTLEIPAGATEAVYRFTAAATAAPATWQMAIQARTLPPNPKDVAGTGQRQVSSEFFPLTIAAPYVKLASEPVAIRRGGTAKFAWKVAPQHPFQAPAAAKLLGLPKGITAVEPAPVLKPESDQLVFELRAAPDALLGQYKEIAVELTFREAGQEIRQRTGVGVLRIDPELKP